MGLKLVIERECSRDHQTALRQFLCCEPGGPEWAMDPQRYIRDLSVRKTPKGILRTLLVVSGDIPLHDDVVGFCEYGVAVETTDEHEGVYPDLVYRHRFEGAWHTSRRHSALLGYRAPA